MISAIFSSCLHREGAYPAIQTKEWGKIGRKNCRSIDRQIKKMSIRKPALVRISDHNNKLDFFSMRMHIGGAR
jgi:hypothetical protein